MTKKEITSKEITDKKERINKILGSDMSKSKKIIALMFEENLERKTISELMNIRYQFVYNVTTNYMDQNGIKRSVTKPAEKKNSIIELVKKNPNIEIREIVRITKSHTNYVRKVVNEYKEDERNKKVK